MKPAFKSEKKHIFREKFLESVRTVMPIVAIVSVLCFTVVPLSTDLLLAFLQGALMVSLGMSLFTVGSESSLTPIGSRMGAVLTKTRNLKLIIALSFALGVFVTIAEPDLQVLAQTVPHIHNLTLIITVGLGVGFFLALSMVRMLFGIRLRYLLLACYGLVFLLAAFAPENQLAVAFDSGGVTTGPMTVPFILAFGVGISYIRSDSRAESDSFGLVALCSIGPILSVLLLSFFYKTDSASYASQSLSWATTSELGLSYYKAIPGYMLEMFLSLLPILIVFVLFQVLSFRLNFRGFMRILIGMLFTYAGLVLFLTGVNVGFSSLGEVLGKVIASSKYKYLLIPLSMMLGWFIISAEPAVFTLQNQIEDVSAGAISSRSVKLSLSVAISIAMGIAMLRVLTGISLMWFLVPGYLIALLLSFFVPDIYTAIAFDSGGVASGPMTATFMLKFIIGACEAVGGDILSDAFGVVALVAMMPLLSVQLMGLASRMFELFRKKETPVMGEEIIEIMEDVL